MKTIADLSKFSIRYVKDSNNNRIGVVCAGPLQNGVINIGWSTVHSNHNDKFDRELGINIAMGRALTGSYAEIPAKLLPSVISMADYINQKPRAEGEQAPEVCITGMITDRNVSTAVKRYNFAWPESMLSQCDENTCHSCEGDCGYGYCDGRCDCDGGSCEGTD